MSTTQTDANIINADMPDVPTHMPSKIHLKEKLYPEKKILMKFIRNLFMIRQKNNQVDVHNVEFLFVKFIVL